MRKFIAAVLATATLALVCFRFGTTPSDGGANPSVGPDAGKPKRPLRPIRPLRPRPHEVSRSNHVLAQ